MASKGIFCLEGLWETNLRKPSTVQPILAFLKQNAGISYIYRDCGTQEEFKFYLSKFLQSRYKDYPILYLAFHGEPGKILISGKTTCSLKDIGELLREKCKGQVVIIGSCSVLDIDKRILKSFLNSTGALAVCGYRNNVDWIRSTAFEMLLLAELQENTFDGRGVKSIVAKCNVLRKKFTDSDKDKDISFRIVSVADFV